MRYCRGFKPRWFAKSWIIFFAQFFAPKRQKSLAYYQHEVLYIINSARNCISSTRSVVYHQFRRNCISSTRSVVYHQAAGEYTPARDEMQGRLAALDDMHRTLCGDDMPSLRLGSKREGVAFDSFSFWCGQEDVEPPSLRSDGRMRRQSRNGTHESESRRSLAYHP